jgi:hypothetical protein
MAFACVGERQLAGGLKMVIHGTKQFNNALLHSLSTIQSAKTQLQLLTASGLTPSLLVSQIRLYDVLLREIRIIRFGLEGRMRCRGMIRRSGIARRNRNSRHLAVPQGNLSNRSE